MPRSTTARRLGALSIATLLAASLLDLGSASAQDAPGVTLNAARRVVTFGQKIRLTGAIEPAAEGETVNIVDEDATVLASTTTDASGHYVVRLEPRQNVKVRAQWVAAFSDEVPLRVKPLLRATLGGVRVFGKGRVHGSLLPAHGDGEVTYTVKRAGKEVGHGRIPLKNGRWFSARVAIKKPGTYHAVVHFSDGDHSPVRESTPSRTTALPTLGIGSKGPMVKVLEKRLRKLHYHLDGVDKRYDYRTSDAVVAFNKVQGRTRTGSVDASTWRALGSPRIPKPVAARPKFHIEVDQTKQVLYMVKKGKVNGVLHVSTGANGYTHDGVYHVYRKLAGTSGGGLYYPSYFDGLRALHGWSEVPTYNASHGCVRLPMWAAQWVFGKAKIGTEVRVYH
jgi:lipoprotein-anchoring transpeptidase ErfK/SrfK